MANYRWEELRARHRQVRQLLWQRGALKRLPCSRPRHPDEERLLIEIAVRRIQRARAAGRLVRLGDRHWRLRFPLRGYNISYHRGEEDRDETTVQSEATG
ncbi:hypothetical protein HRbin15_02323 [bacterium HR15]|nr:hypothetical protein HRbin15_02323 [bacterium HR15]